MINESENYCILNDKLKLGHLYKDFELNMIYMKDILDDEEFDKAIRVISAILVLGNYKDRLSQAKQ